MAVALIYRISILLLTLELLQVIDVLILFKPKRFGDGRGWFSETFHAARYADAGILENFVQDNHSLSVSPGTVRGLHFQAPPYAQGKLVRVVRGRVIDVAVDIRSGSPTYGLWRSVELSAENGHQLYVPVGFAHGFATLEDNAEVVYKVTNYYNRASEGGLAWDCPRLQVDWGIDRSQAVLSDKDKTYPGMDAFESPFTYGGRPMQLSEA